MKPLKKQGENKKPLSIGQILVDTNTDDCTISQFLEEENNPNYKPPYGDAIVKKFRLKPMAGKNV